MSNHCLLRYNGSMKREEAFITPPTHGEDYRMTRWQSFVEEPKQSQWVWAYLMNRVSKAIKTTDQIYVETTLDNYVETNKRRKSGTGHPEPSIRLEDGP